MRFTHKTYVELSGNEIEALKDMEETIYNLVSEFQGACEDKGEIEDEALEACEADGTQLLKAYNNFIYTLRTYGNFE